MPENRVVESLGKNGKGLRNTDCKLPSSHWDEKYSIENIVNNIAIPMYDTLWILKISDVTLVKMNDWLTTMLYI